MYRRHLVWHGACKYRLLVNDRHTFFSSGSMTTARLASSVFFVLFFMFLGLDLKGKSFCSLFGMTSGLKCRV
jgi:hypothetical protein